MRRGNVTWRGGVVNKYTLVQTRFEQIPTETLREAIVKHSDAPRADVSRAVRTARGILWENCERKVADAIRRALADHDYGVRTIEAESIPHLPEPRFVRWMELDTEELRIPDGIHGQTRPMKWTSVFVIALGQMVVPDVSYRIDDQRFGKHSAEETMSDSQEPPRYQKRSDLVDVLDVVGIDDKSQLRYLRFPSHELVYERIMGTETNLPKFERFLVLIEFFVEHCVEAVVSPETRKLLVNRAPTERMIVSEAAHATTERSVSQYTRWLLHKAICREQQA